MLRPLIRNLITLALVGVATARLSATTSGAPTSPALRAANPRLLSGGLYSALAANGALGGLTPVSRARADGVADLSKGKPPAVLDARVGVNVRLGDDPVALPATQRGQAEPHIARSAAIPDLLLATFQEGRFAAGGGSVDCGYALSKDGGLSWTRALIPRLTTASGGSYHRATDPVAAVGPQGDFYLATLVSLDDAFGSADLVVSRSTDAGATWLAPAIAFHQITPLAAPDKDWLAVNDFPGTPNAGRLVATWTNFTSTASGASTGDNLLAAVSDDRGATWSAPSAITPTGSFNQGSQPLFLPDGSLAVVYATFATPSNVVNFSIQCKRSTDGGRTFPAAASNVVTLVNGYDDPDLRSGVFLPSATVARTTGEIFVSYVAVVAGTPRVMVVKTSDQGATWSAPIIASDNPIGRGVDNPAVAVTPDGRTVSIVFVDKRNSAIASDGHTYFLDHYAALSFDGGATWQPNVRLSEMSSDVRYAPRTDQGYMLGDYLAIAASLASDQSFVPIWCDTRTGDADPFVTSFVAAANESFQAWVAARHVRNQIPWDGDSDRDGVFDYLEYVDGTNPLAVDFGENLVFRHTSASTLDVMWTQRANPVETNLNYPVTLFGCDLPPVYDARGIRTFGSGGMDLPADQFPSIQPRPGLVWRGIRVDLSDVSPAGHFRGIKFSAGLGPAVLETIAAFNTDSRLINLSTRSVVSGNGGQLIAGFVIDGPKTILVRAAGPALATFGVSGVLPDPRLVFASTDPAGFDTFTNDNWQQGNATAALFTRLGAFPFASGSLDAAFQLTLGRRSYSAIMSDSNNATGTGLVEIYDADAIPGASAGPRLLNLSTRGNVGPGTNALIAGFVLKGMQPRRVLLRAIGPSLAQFNVAGALVDPVLTLYDSTGKVVATNDDWEISRSSAALAATAQNVGAFALTPASLDAALLITLAPGAYTAVITGANGVTGTVLVEVYDAN